MSAAKAREIIKIVEAGTGDNGQHVRFKVEFADGSFETFELEPQRVGEFIGKLAFGADAANHGRLEAAGYLQRIEPTGVMDALDIQAQPSGIEPVTVLRVTIAKSVHLGFRIPRDRVQAIASALLATVHPSGKDKH